MDKIAIAQIETLKKAFGTYSQVARELGITPRHFRRIRAGEVNFPKPLRNLVSLMASRHVGRCRQ